LAIRVRRQHHQPQSRKFRGVGSAPRSGRGGRRFKSCHSDHYLAEIESAIATGSATDWRDEERTLPIPARLALTVTRRRIFKVPVAPEDRPWMWASGHGGHIERAAHGYEPTREAAMAAFAKSWRRECR
jgi:hypothetical protein